MNARRVAQGGDERFGSGQGAAAEDDVEVFPDERDEAESGHAIAT
jgi:hypothetical protein